MRFSGHTPALASTVNPLNYNNLFCDDPTCIICAYARAYIDNLRFGGHTPLTRKHYLAVKSTLLSLTQDPRIIENIERGLDRIESTDDISRISQDKYMYVVVQHTDTSMICLSVSDDRSSEISTSQSLHMIGCTLAFRLLHRAAPKILFGTIPVRDDHDIPIGVPVTLADVVCLSAEGYGIVKDINALSDQEKCHLVEACVPVDVYASPMSVHTTDFTTALCEIAKADSRLAFVRPDSVVLV